MNSNNEHLDVGYIYKIWSDTDDKIYYGSCKDWKERRRSHKGKYNKCNTMYIDGELKFEVIEILHNITRYNLKCREREYMDNHDEEGTGLCLINKQVPNQSPSEYHKKRYEKNSNLFAAKQKVYYWKNHQKELARNKKYQEKRKGDTWFCNDCHKIYAWTTKKTHIKSKKHINNVLNSVATTTSTECSGLEHTSIQATANSATN